MKLDSLTKKMIHNKVVNEFWNMPNVKRDDNTISFYQLYCEVKNYLDKCYNKAFYNEKLVRKVNHYSSSTELIVKDISIDLSGNIGDSSKILIIFAKKRDIDPSLHNYLCRDNEGYVYWKYSFPVLDHDTFVNTYNDFIELFDFREEFINDFYDDHYKNDGNIECCLSFDYYGIKPILTYNQHCEVKCVLDNNELKNLKNNECIRIMKKIPVNTDSLPNICKIALGYDKKKSLTKKKTI